GCYWPLAAGREGLRSIVSGCRTFVSRSRNTLRPDPATSRVVERPKRGDGRGVAAGKVDAPAAAVDPRLVERRVGFHHREPDRAAERVAVRGRAHVADWAPIALDDLGVIHERLGVLHQYLHQA